MVRAQEAISHYVRETDDLTRKIVLKRWCDLLSAIPGFAVVRAFELWPEPRMPHPHQIADDATRIAAEARRNGNRQLRIVADNPQPEPATKPASLADQIRICREELAKAPDSAILSNMLTRLEARQRAEQAQREDGAA